MAAEIPNARVALVTGGGGAIGGAVAAALARQGYAVAVNDASRDRADAASQALRAAGFEALSCVASVADPGEVAAMVTKVIEAYGGLDVLVNSAGVPGPFALLADTADADWRQTLSVQLDGTFHCMRAAIAPMKLRGGGCIVNIASIAGVHGTVGSCAYGAAKAGVINLTHTAAKELARLGIAVNCIAPGMVATPVNEALHAKGSRFIASALEGTATGAMTRPEDIAALAVFLAGGAAANISGQVFVQDGGSTITLSADRYMRDALSAPRAKARGEPEEK